MSETTSHVPRLTKVPDNAENRAGEHRFDIADPVMLDRCPQLILPFSLGNYLSQLSRSRLDSCVIFALRLEGIENLFGACKSHEFAQVLDGVVGAVRDAIDCPKLLMSYEGNGTLLCIQQGSDAPAWPEIEDQIQTFLNRRNLRHDDGTAIAVQVSVGNPITPNASRNQRVKKTFDRAIDRAVMRERSKENGARPLTKRSARRRPMRRR
jgi:hypothetical protein